MLELTCLLLEFFESALGLSELALEGLFGLLLDFIGLFKLLEAFLQFGLEVSGPFLLIFEELVQRLDFALVFGTDLLDFLGQLSLLGSQLRCGIALSVLFLLERGLEVLHLLLEQGLLLVKLTLTLLDRSLHILHLVLVDFFCIPVLILDLRKLLAQFLNGLSVLIVVLRFCLLDVLELLLQNLVVGLGFTLLHHYFLPLGLKALLLVSSIFFGITSCLLMFLFKLKFDVLLSSELTLDVTALNIQDFCHKLSFALSQIKSLLRKFKALSLIVVAKFTQRKVDLLEVVGVRIVDALLLHLFNFSKELNKHLLSTLLACLLVLCAHFFCFLLEYLLELGDTFIHNLWITDHFSLQVSHGDSFGVVKQSVEVHGVGWHDDRFKLFLQVFYCVCEALLSL